MSTPTLINLPPPPSDTPSDMGPGTPNSSLSALSTTAIKDGHQGHTMPHHHGHTHTYSTTSSSSTNTLDAERADRISRLAGLERVATLRGASSHLAPGASYNQPPQPAGYFDNAGAPQVKERSTVGSASATGSVGGRTRTWASGSDMFETDKMSEEPDDGVGSSAGLSDEGNASLVGFGETASSTFSGPLANSGRTTIAGRAAAGSPIAIKHGRPGSGSPMQGIQGTNPAMVDGFAHSRDTVDTTSHLSEAGAGDVHMTGQGQARTMSQRSDDGEGNKRTLASSDDVRGISKPYFEGK